MAARWVMTRRLWLCKLSCRLLWLQLNNFHGILPMRKHAYQCIWATPAEIYQVMCRINTNSLQCVLPRPLKMGPLISSELPGDSLHVQDKRRCIPVLWATGPWWPFLSCSQHPSSWLPPLAVERWNWRNPLFLHANWNQNNRMPGITGWTLRFIISNLWLMFEKEKKRLVHRPVHSNWRWALKVNDCFQFGPVTDPAPYPLMPGLYRLVFHRLHEESR